MMRGQRQSGPGGGITGGPTGIGRGSPRGEGSCRLNGSMMIGGMAGGAEGGLLGPPLANDQAGIASPYDRTGIQYRKDSREFKQRIPTVRPAPAMHISGRKTCTLSHADGGARGPSLQYNHASEPA